MLRFFHQIAQNFEARGIRQSISNVEGNVQELELECGDNEQLRPPSKGKGGGVQKHNNVRYE